MADFTVTAANVIAATTTARDLFERKANGVVDVGDAIALDTVDTTRVVRADANDADLHKALGVALNSAAGAGQPVRYVMVDSLFVPGWTAAAGDVVILSSNAGKMAPVADLLATMYCVVMGVMVTTTAMNLRPLIGGLKV